MLLTSSDRARLFNCCTDYAQPDWARFVQLEIAGCKTIRKGKRDEHTEGLQSASTAEFFSIYGRFPEPDGTCEAITDIADAADVMTIAGTLALLSRLPVIVHPSLGSEPAARGVRVNAETRLYVIPCGDDGWTSLGFDYAEKRRRGVLAWLGAECPPVPMGTLAHYADYERAMNAGARHASTFKKQCPAELEPRLIGLEGKRVEITYASGDRDRFTVGKSTGWLPCHLKLRRRDSSGGAPVYIPADATVRVIA